MDKYFSKQLLKCHGLEERALGGKSAFLWCSCTKPADLLQQQWKTGEAGTGGSTICCPPALGMMACGALSARLREGCVWLLG